jgi:hypothetical protein
MGHEMEINVFGGILDFVLIYEEIWNGVFGIGGFEGDLRGGVGGGGALIEFPQTLGGVLKGFGFIQLD